MNNYKFYFLQYGTAELFYRVVNFRDADNQTMVMPSPQDGAQYMHPPQVYINITFPILKFS